jgi:hypothetical protein
MKKFNSGKYSHLQFEGKDIKNNTGNMIRFIDLLKINLSQVNDVRR